MSNPNAPAGGTVYIRFTTNDASGGAVAPSTAFEAADVKLYKDNSNVERTSQAGWTMTSPFDTYAGLHTLAIDTSDNTDAGFYAEDHDYFAVLQPSDETVDGQTVVSVIGEFFIGPVIADVVEWNSVDVATPTTGGVPEVDVTFWLGTAAATPTVAGVPEVDVTHWIGTAAATPTVAGVPEVDVTHWIGTAAATPTVAGVPEVDVTHWLGTPAATPTTAGVPEVDITYINGVAVSTTTAQLGVNVVQVSGDGTAADTLELFAEALDQVTGQIDSGTFAAGAIDAAAIADNAIDEGAIANDAITAAKIATGAIDADAIADNAIDAGAIAANAITAAKIATDAIDADALADGAITAATFAAGAIDATAIAANAITSSELADSAVQEIVDAVWDEVNTGATHNIANSTGRQLRQVGGQSIALYTGTAQAGAATTITLAAGATSIDNAFVGCTIVITGGTGLFQVRRIIAYNGTTKVATVDRTWGTNPDNTSTFAVYANSNPIISDEGTAQAGGGSTITLRAGASATDDIYINAFVTILSGTGSGQTRIIADYVGATKVATTDSAWDTNPDNTSIYAVIPNAQQAPLDNVYTGPSVAEIWSQTMSELSAVPGVDATVIEALEWCFTLMRNKRTQDATTETVFLDDGASTLATAAKSDNGTTFTRGEYS